MRYKIDWTLLKHKIEGTLSKDEEKKLSIWLGKSPENLSILNELQKRWANSNKQKYDNDYAFKKLKHKLDKLPSTKTVELKVRSWLKIAASIAFLITSATILYFYSTQSVNPSNIQYASSYTKPNERTTVILSDGTIVHLNSRSELKYPEIFRKNKREVELLGEAYFEVTKDAERPFIIKTGEITTTVLGTSFNVRSMPDQDIEVTVTSGKVNIKKGNKKSKSINLVRGQQATYERNNSTLNMKSVDVQSYTAWLNRTLNFDRISFEDAIEQIKRVYNIEIKIENNASNDCLIRGQYQNEELEDILQGLQLIIDFEYHFQNDTTIIINGNGCIN